MKPHELFMTYVNERRDQVIDGFTKERLPHLTRYIPTQAGRDGFVLFTDLPPGTEREHIRDQIRFFAERGEVFEWKLYDFDQPANLRPLLEQEGFVAGPTEAFMIFPLNQELPPIRRTPPGVRLVRVNSESGVRDVVAVQEEVWNQDLSFVFNQLAGELRDRPDDISILCAYMGDRPVGTGWTTYAPQSSFADLHGGAVLSDLRGQGIYSMLFHDRCQEAKRRGYRYLAVDAAPMSRPILEEKGFAHICFTYPMRRESES